VKREFVHDGTYGAAEGDALAISMRGETAVIQHFQERTPYGLFVRDVPQS
jgi:hypothetical protein